MLQDSINLALTNFELTIQVDPAYAEGHYMKGYANELLGNFEAAKSSYQNALNLNSELTIAQEALTKFKYEIINDQYYLT